MADVSELISYGGDPAIIATRGEIERVQSGLAAATNLLMGQVEVTDFLTHPLKRIGLAMELPAVRERIDYLMKALDAASNEYFDGEALIAKELTDIGLISAPVIVAGLLGVVNDAGLLNEHPNNVSAVEVKKFRRIAPEGIGDLARRTRLNFEPGHITIERFGSSFVAYIPGTQTWNPISGTNPLDFTSNLQAMKGPGQAASEIGVQLALNQALKNAGAGADAKVLLVGHSQGGMIAANIAQRDSRVKGLVTLGSPISQVASQLRVPVVALEHSNDLVPKLGLKANPMAQNMVTVVREVQISKPIDTVVEAHDISNYVKTAEMADESQELGLKRVREQVLAVIGVEKGSQMEGEVTVYKLSRH